MAVRALGYPRSFTIPQEAVVLAFRWLVVACQGTTLLITWPLWQAHTAPPMLPVLPLPAFDMGVLLLLSLALILIAHRPGIVVHTILMAYAVLIDQTRLQPEIVSLVFLLWGTLPDPNSVAVSRAHLISLWVFAGINKLLSPAFMNGTAQWMLSGLVPGAPQWFSQNFGYVIVATETGTGVLALFPRTRKLAALTALGLHLGILLDLSPVGHNWNQAVWPWNVALAFSGLALIATWKEAPLQSWRNARWLVRLLVIYILIAPAGFYIGLTDAYLAHNLYTSNTPSASVLGSATSPSVTWSVFNVPFPPEPRLYEQLFRLTCRPGDQMMIEDSRWWFRVQGAEQRTLTCSAAPPKLS